MDYASATSLLTAGLRYADSIEQSYCAHLMSATAAMVDWAEGRWADAAGQAGHALADRGCRRGAEFARWTIGYIEMSRGDLEAADDDLAQGVAFGITSESIELILPPLWGQAEVAILGGDPERAIALCRDALDRSQAIGERLLVPFVVTGVRAYQAAGTSVRGGCLAGGLRRSPRRPRRGGGPGARAWARTRGDVRRRDRGRPSSRSRPP